jgi:uncharacterized protein (DUF433 family)
VSRDDLLARITVNPKVMVGQPCIRGMRITVQFILETLAAGNTEQELLDEFTVLEPEDIRAAFLYAAEVLDECPVYTVAS